MGISSLSFAVGRFPQGFECGSVFQQPFRYIPVLRTEGVQRSGGEQGGGPSSVEFCHKVGLTYVSCSPYRVPIARLAAAQAAIKDQAE